MRNIDYPYKHSNGWLPLQTQRTQLALEAEAIENSLYIAWLEFKGLLIDIFRFRYKAACVIYIQELGVPLLYSRTHGVCLKIVRRTRSSWPRRLLITFCGDRSLSAVHVKSNIAEIVLYIVCIDAKRTLAAARTLIHSKNTETLLTGETGRHFFKQLKGSRLNFRCRLTRVLCVTHNGTTRASSAVGAEQAKLAMRGCHKSWNMCISSSPAPPGRTQEEPQRGPNVGVLSLSVQDPVNGNNIQVLPITSGIQKYPAVFSVDGLQS